jgi:hypothetical protein
VIVALTLTACTSSADGTDTSPSGVASKGGVSTGAVSTPGATAPPKEAPADDMRFNPCKLVTSADLTTVLGGTFSAIETDNPQIVGSFSERNCGYIGPNDRTVQIMTEVDDQPGGTAWKASVTAATSNLAGGSMHEEVPGVGDEAFYGNSATIVARKGKVVVTINFLGEETTDTVMPLLKTLAGKAMNRVNG